jgi:putative sterol carrier protein
MAEIQPYLQKMVDGFANPDIQTALKGFTKTLQFEFKDTGEKWLIKVDDGSKATQEILEKPDMTVVTTTDTLAGIMDKKINANTAYMQRKIQIKGSLEDLFRLQKLML